MALYFVFLGLIAIERVGELILSRRNAARAFAAGAIEVGQAHFRVMTVFHTAFLVACVLETWLLQRVFPGTFGYVALAVSIAAQALRYWAIGTLGERWNTRVIVLPTAPVVVGGPYRFVRHPNYVAVIVEMAAIPLVMGNVITAVVFSIGNALLLKVRIGVEEKALGEKYDAAFGKKPRFLPVGETKSGVSA